MKGHRLVGSLQLISLQEISDQLGLEATSLSAIFTKVRNAPPYYQDPIDGSQHLRYVEMHVYESTRKAVQAALAAGLRRPRLPEEVRPAGRNDGKFMSFVRKWLCDANLWTPEQNKCKPAEERRGKKREIYNPPISWPEELTSLFDTIDAKDEPGRTLSAADITAIADAVVEKLIVRGMSVG